jgi:diguanylate cyclase (GGDEF)-like protein
MAKDSPVDFDRRTLAQLGQMDRRKGPVLDSQGYWWPEKSQVAVQFMTRYVFFALGSLFFLTVDSYRPVALSLNALLAAYGIYFVVNSVLFLMAMRSIGVATLRVGMLVDICLVTVSVIHDPYPVPPSALAYLMVIFGNGMRYGMRPFAESAVLATLGMVLSYGIRYRLGGFAVTPADLFYGLFWSVLVFYAFLLMGQVDIQRKLLAYRSRYDSLTGLLNRNGFIESVEAKLAHISQDLPQTLVFVDINDFKSINDRYGHAAGDRVLHEIARILSESTESELVCRWGGDEFVALLDMSEVAARECLNRIDERTRLWSLGNGLPVSVSFGTSCAPFDGTDLDTLLSVADIKLYQSKGEQLPA